MYQEEFLSDKDYPDAEDIEEFGHDSPPDYSPLTIGYVGDTRPSFWTKKRIVLAIVAILLIAVLLLTLLFRGF